MSDDEIEVIEMVEKNKTGSLAAVHCAIVFAIWCIIGLAVDYWLFVVAGAVTAWNNPLTYLVMIFWPVVLIWKFLIIVFWLVVIVAAIFGVIAIYKGVFG